MAAGRRLTLGADRLVLTLDRPARGIASTIVGGGIGPVRTWLNLEVDEHYARLDPVAHLGEEAAGLPGPVAATMTAARVARYVQAEVGGAWVVATVGLSVPLAAAGTLALRGSADGPQSSDRTAHVGTINIAAVLDTPLTDAGLVNAVQTMTEAKVQALVAGGLQAANDDGPATGTATDSVLVTCPDPRTGAGEPTDFAGPASQIGHDLAVAVHACTTEGLADWRVRNVAAAGTPTAPTTTIQPQEPR